jgi:hypothetical protein
VYYPEVVLRDRHVENGAAANASLDDRRHLKKRFRRRVLRRCGVAEPSTREVASSLKVLDDWEARNPGRRRSLLLGQDTQQIGTGPGEVVSNNSTGAAPGADVAATAAPVILTVKVWWHVMKAGNTPRFGAWTRAQAAKSVQLANRYFAGSPFRFVLAGVTQSVNAEWFQCKFDDDYATGNAGPVRPGRVTVLFGPSIRPAAYLRSVFLLFTSLHSSCCRARVQVVAAPGGGRHAQRVYV